MAVDSAENDRFARFPSKPTSAEFGSIRRSDGGTGRYRFEVLATTVADAIRCVGAYICDHSLSGWDVTVNFEADVSITPAEARALRILGAAPIASAGLADSSAAPAGRVVAVCIERSRDPMIRDALRAVIDDGSVTVLAFGSPGGTVDDEGHADHTNCDAGDFRSSNAARAFKRHALAALGIDGSTACSETLRREYPTS